MRFPKPSQKVSFSWPIGIAIIISLFITFASVVSVNLLYNKSYSGIYRIGPNESILVISNDNKEIRLLVNPEHAKIPPEFTNVFWGSERANGITCEYKAIFTGDISNISLSDKNHQYDKILYLHNIKHLELIRLIPRQMLPQSLNNKSSITASQLPSHA